MEGAEIEGDPYRPARDDRAAVIERVLERLPTRVAAALQGDRESLIGLLLIAADVAWQSRADVLGTVEEVATAAHLFADAVADCYSADRPPSGRMCDTGFALADRVDALAVEVLHLRRRAGIAGDAALAPLAPAPAREARHLARAHTAALRDAVATGRVISPPDVEAAEALYRAVVALGRQEGAQAADSALRDITDRSQPAKPPPQS